MKLEQGRRWNVGQLLSVHMAENRAREKNPQLVGSIVHRLANAGSLANLRWSIDLETFC